jgi:hypothetical protein
LPSTPICPGRAYHIRIPWTPCKALSPQVVTDEFIASRREAQKVEEQTHAERISTLKEQYFQLQRRPDVRNMDKLDQIIDVDSLLHHMTKIDSGASRLRMR